MIKSAASAASLETRKIQIILPENPMPFWYWSYSLARNFFDTSHATSARHQRINVQLPFCEMHSWPCRLVWSPGGQAVIKSAASAASLETRKIQIILPENPMPFWYWSYSLARNFFDTSHATSARHQRINVQLPSTESGPAPTQIRI